jgi:hypothetical protein
MRAARTIVAMGFVLGLCGFDSAAPYAMRDPATGDQITCPPGDLKCLAVCHTGGFAGRDPDEAQYIEQHAPNNQYRITLGPQTPEQEEALQKKIVQLDHDSCLLNYRQIRSE